MSDPIKPPVEFSVHAAVHNTRGTPAVAIKMGEHSIFPTPGEAREMAMAILMAAQESELDAIMVALAIRKGASNDDAHKMLAEFRDEKRRAREEVR